MRSIILRSAVIVAAVATSVAGAAQAPDYTKVLAEARQALGGDARLNAIHSFRAKGAIEQPSVQTRSKTFGSFEVACVLPDKYVETDTLRYVDTGRGADVDLGTLEPLSGSGTPGFSASETITKIGFNGADPIYEPNLTYADWMRSGWRFQPPPVNDSQLKRTLTSARQQFVAWTLALFATSFAGVPVQFRDNGFGRSVFVTGNEVKAAIEFDPVTHLPARFLGIEFLDYRDVDGFKVPSRLRRPPGDGSPSADWVVREFKYDVSFSPGTFQPTKVSGAGR